MHKQVISESVYDKQIQLQKTKWTPCGVAKYAFFAFASFGIVSIPIWKRGDLV